MAYPDWSGRLLSEEHTHISTSFLQRRLRIGYPRADRLMEQVEEKRAKVEGDVGYLLPYFNFAYNIANPRARDIAFHKIIGARPRRIP